MPLSKLDSVLHISRTHYLALNLHLRMQENAAQGIRQNKIFLGCMPLDTPSQTSRLLRSC